MGNCGSREFVDDGNDNKKKLFQDIEFFKNRFIKKDDLIEFIEGLIPSIYLKDFSHFARNYRIKKNIKCQKDLFYRLKVIEHTRSGRLFNVKMIKKSEILDMGINKFKAFFQNEIKALTYFKHPQLEYLVDVYYEKVSEDTKIYLVINYTSKYSLLDIINEKIKEKKKFEDKEVAIVLKMLIEIAYKFKTEKFLHRNICPDNIYFLKEGRFDTICLRNFYFSTFTESNPKIRGVMGPLAYMAPEMIFDTVYDFKLDIWSIGVIAYMMLTLEQPLIDCGTRDVVMEIMKNEKAFKKQKDLKKMGINSDAIILLYKMLVYNKENRCSSEMLIQDKYLKDYASIYNIHAFAEFINFPEDDIAILTYKIKNLPHLHNIIYYIYFHLLHYFVDAEEIIFINELYKYFDKNNDGQTKYSEMEDVMRADENCYASGTIQRYVDILKVVNDTQFFKSSVPPFMHDCYTYEFFFTTNLIIKMYVNRNNQYAQKRIEIMFNELDKDKDGSICIEEIQSIFHGVVDPNYIKDSLKFIEGEEAFDQSKIANIDEVNLDELKNLFFYECIKIFPDQIEEMKEKKMNHSFLTKLG